MCRAQSGSLGATPTRRFFFELRISRRFGRKTAKNAKTREKVLYRVQANELCSSEAENLRQGGSCLGLVRKVAALEGGPRAGSLSSCFQSALLQRPR